MKAQYSRKQNFGRRVKLAKLKFRSEQAMYLVETLVALILGAMLSFALLSMLTETMRLNTTNQNRQAADLAAQTVLDALKRTDPSVWQFGSYDLLVNSLGAGQRCTALSGTQQVCPLPVWLNIGDLNWSSLSMDAKFSGRVILDIQPGVTSGSKVAVVTVIYNDGSNIASKTIGTLSSLHARGVNYWP